MRSPRPLVADPLGRRGTRAPRAPPRTRRRGGRRSSGRASGAPPGGTIFGSSTSSRTSSRASGRLTKSSSVAAAERDRRIAAVERATEAVIPIIVADQSSPGEPWSGLAAWAHSVAIETSQERPLASVAAAKSASMLGPATETSRDQPSSSTSSLSAITTSPAWDAITSETRQAEMSSSACSLLTGSGTGPVPGSSPPHPAIVTAARTEEDGGEKPHFLV